MVTMEHDDVAGVGVMEKFNKLRGTALVRFHATLQNETVDASVCANDKSDSIRLLGKKRS